MTNLLIFGIFFLVYILFCSIIFTFLLREFHLRNVISRYPNQIAKATTTSSSDILLLLSKILTDAISPRQKEHIFQSRRPIGYDFVCNHYPATLGNLSEIARRKFGRDTQNLKYIQQQALILYTGLQFAKATLILNSMANTYRIMLDLGVKNIEDNEKEFSEIYINTLKRMKIRIEEYDIFKAYIELMSIENQNDVLSRITDYEIISFMTFKMWLESFFQSYQYPINGTTVVERMGQLINQIDFFINKKWNPKDFIMNFKLQAMAK